MGVQLPAQTALHSNESHVRALLVHEFAHSFYYMTEIVNRADRGLPLSLWDGLSDPFNDANDRAKLVNPFDWFCKQDAEAFMYHSDHRLNEIDKDLPELRGELPVVPPRLDFNVTARFCIEEGIVAHIRRLREAAS